MREELTYAEAVSIIEGLKSANLQQETVEKAQAFLATRFDLNWERRVLIIGFILTSLILGILSYKLCNPPPPPKQQVNHQQVDHQHIKNHQHIKQQTHAGMLAALAITDPAIKIKQPAQCPGTFAQELKQILRHRRIHFASNKAVLRTRSKHLLDAIASLLNRCSHIKIRVQGHTDDTHSKAHNTLLSRWRAYTVVEYLITRGVARARLEYAGCGKQYRLYHQKTKEARAKNRRVLFLQIPTPPKNGCVVRNATQKPPPHPNNGQFR